MTSSRRCLLGLALFVGLASPVLAQRPPVPTQPFGPQPVAFAWWKNEAFRKELGLTADQCARVDKIWESTRPELRQEWDELYRMEDKLSHLIQVDADEATLARQIDRVETARANTNKTRSMMLVQMLKALTPDQRSRFNALYARWQAELQKQQLQQPATPPSATHAPPRDPNKRPED